MLMASSILVGRNVEIGLVRRQSLQKFSVCFHDPGLFSLPCRDYDEVENRMFFIQNLRAAYGERTSTVPYPANVCIVNSRGIEHIMRQEQVNNASLRARSQ